jgi:trimethylamine---corrinoid protein Co-methyltransferase
MSIQEELILVNKTKRFQYKPLSDEDIDSIHQTSIKVLETTGFEVQHEEALKLFKSAGAKVKEGNIVTVDSSVVMKLTEKAPSSVILYAGNKNLDLNLGTGQSYFATGGTALNILDYKSEKQRPAKLNDLIDVIRITDKMKNIHCMLLPTYPTEIDVENVDVNRFFAGLCYTDKHIMGGVYTKQGIKNVIKMASEIAGSKKALQEKPFISMIACGISPLRLDTKYGEYMIQIARENIPLAVPVEPLAGATAPVTLAGTLVIQNCDSLINVMLTQLANPGAPVIYGSVATSVNMHDGSYLGGPVESGLINAATAQLARYYKLPYYSTAGISDTKTLDTQCGYETAVNTLLLGLVGGDLIHDAAGLMEFANTVSKEKLVIDNEILGMALRAFKGIQVDEKTLAFDVIDKAGPGGNFISERHTRKYLKKEHFLPQLTDRSKRQAWSANGKKTIAETAHEKATEILSEEPLKYLSDDQISSIKKMFPEIV